MPKSQENCFQIFCTGEINPFSFAEQIVQPGKCGTYCWRIILGDFLQRQYHTFCPCATLLLSTREAGQLFSAFCNFCNICLNNEPILQYLISLLSWHSYTQRNCPSEDLLSVSAILCNISYASHNRSLNTSPFLV